MKNKMVLIIIGVVLVILLGCLIYMSQTCTGLWERQVSKIPANFLFKKEGEVDDYTKCVYIGFSGMIKKLKEKNDVVR